MISWIYSACSVVKPCKDSKLATERSKSFDADLFAITYPGGVDYTQGALQQTQMSVLISDTTRLTFVHIE